jgi:hypothetical protein
MTDQPKLWREMSDAEKGALLLAAHEGKQIEYLPRPPGSIGYQGWRLVVGVAGLSGDIAYRIKPEPKREAVRLVRGGDGKWQERHHKAFVDTHAITFDTIDGEPDCASIRMEKIGGAS